MSHLEGENMLCENTSVFFSGYRCAVVGSSPLSQIIEEESYLDVES